MLQEYVLPESLLQIVSLMKLTEVCCIRLASHVTNPSEESMEKAPAHNKASKPAKTKLAPKETPIPPAEAGFVLIQFFVVCGFWSYTLYISHVSFGDMWL